MKPPNVNIVLSDRNWVLEQIGQALETRLSNIALNDLADPSADINYYITFACRKAAVGTLEMAFFTHMEQAPELQKLFIDTARTVDLPVCQSNRYRDVLMQNGIDNAVVISPGVDREVFDVKLRVGVVGRAYHTGRKGEALIAQLMDMDGIDWHFTGTGWPQPGRFINADAMPDFYRSMDYILVPATYEGGPMCVPEALAVGTPVIASDVGWVDAFPHIPFKINDAADLRRVLAGLINQKRVMRASTQEYSWDIFAAAHEKAFAGVMKAAGKTGIKSWFGGKKRKAPPLSTPIRLLMHGAESKTLGGPTIRVPRTASELQKLGLQAKAEFYSTDDPIGEDIVHLFNVWTPDTALAALHRLKAAGKRIVFSPIYLDLSERAFWQNRLPILPLDKNEAYQAAYHTAKHELSGRERLHEAMPGYHAKVREMLDLADHVIFLSQLERNALAEIGAVVEDARASYVPNPVDSDAWQGNDPKLFRDTYLQGLIGPQDYVLCIGRIEERKNQLLLALAMRDVPLRLVLIGHEANPEYAERLRAEAGPDCLIVNRLEPGGEMLCSALAGATVFALPSWAEGASLAVLEAAASGASMVLSDRSSEQEYFGDLAHYCDVGDPNSIRDAIKNSFEMDAKTKANRAEALKAKVAQDYNWQKYAEETAAVYEKTLNAARRRLKTYGSVVPATPVSDIVLDITTMAAHSHGLARAIVRAEVMLSQSLRLTQANIRFICWNDTFGCFVDVPAQSVTPIGVWRYNQHPDPMPANLSETSVLVVSGDSWRTHIGYVEALEDLKARSRCHLMTLVQDMTTLACPFYEQQDLLPDARNRFQNLAVLTDHFFVPSSEISREVARYTARHVTPMPLISVLPFGTTALPAPAAESTASLISTTLREEFGNIRFVLAASDIVPSSNYEMVHRVWARFKQDEAYDDLHLVIAGAITAQSGPIIESLRNDTRLHGRVHILSDVSNTDLSWLYRSCLFTVFPAFFAGAALPVGQSLAQGKLCLSTSAVFGDERIADSVILIDPDDFISWHQQIRFYAGSTSARVSREAQIAGSDTVAHTPVPWLQTAQSLCDFAANPQETKLARPVFAGEPAYLGIGARALSVLCDADWHPRQSWGRWTRKDTATLAVNLARFQSLDNALIPMIVRAKANVPNGSYKDLRIKAGGTCLATMRFYESRVPSDIIISVPQSALDADGLLTLTFDCSVTPGGKKRQHRLQGICVKSVCAFDPVYSNILQALEYPTHWSVGQHSFQYSFGNPEHHAIVAPQHDVHPAWGLGSTAGQFDLKIYVLPNGIARTLRLFCRPIATPQHPVSAEIFWNETVLKTMTWTDDAPVQIECLLPSSLLSGQGPSVLRIKHGSHLTPRDLGIGFGQTICGVGVFEVWLTPQENEQ